MGFGPALMQGQGMENVGDKTLYWYSLWRIDGQVRLATWERDRFGYLTPHSGRSPAKLITCPLRPEGKEGKVFLNVSGIGEYAALRVHVLDIEFRSTPGFPGEDSPLIRESGFRVPVAWRAGDILPKGEGPVRLMLDFGRVSPDCVRPEDTRLHAIYVGA